MRHGLACILFAGAGAILPAAAGAAPAARAPWTRPLAFRALPGWSVGASGTVRRARNGSGASFRLGHPESTAWIANVRYRDFATTDPPQRTVHRLRRGGIVVWAAIAPVLAEDVRDRIDLHLQRFRRGRCCDGTPPPYTREWDAAGTFAHGRYELIVRVYFGSTPTAAMLAAARRALAALSPPPAT